MVAVVSQLERRAVLRLRAWCGQAGGEDREQQETNVHGNECLAGKGAMRGEDSMGRSIGGRCIRNYATAASD
jgi:hypothetical protein